MRTIYSLLLLAFSVATVAQVPTNGLLAHFPFNNTLNDTTANAHTLSPVANPAAISYVDGHDTINQALDLANANGCAYLISDSAFAFNDSAITLSFWAYIDSNVSTGISPQALAVATTATTNIASHSVEYQRSNGAAVITCYAYYTPTFSSYSMMHFSILPYLNQWRHYTYVYNKANPGKGMQLFIDGQEVASRPVDSTLTLNPGSNVIKLGVAGSYCVTTAQYDDLLVYGRSLTNAEVANIFNTQYTGCPRIAGTLIQAGQSLQTCSIAGDFNSLQAGYSYPANGVSYQWLKDGVAIPNATGDSYSYELVALSNGVYSVQLTTGCDTLVLGDHTLTVYPIPGQPTITSSGLVLSCNEAADDYAWYLDGTLISSGSGQQSITATANGEYTVVVAVHNPAANNCSSEASLPITVAGVGIGEVNGGIGISLYPNPTNQTLAITTTEVLTGVEIYNLMGQRVIRQEGDTKQINVAELPAGTYYLHVASAQGGVRKPFVKY